jgi:hypothetical protein
MNKKTIIAIVAGLGAVSVLLLFCCGVGGFAAWLWDVNPWQQAVQPIVGRLIPDRWFR